MLRTLGTCFWSGGRLMVARAGSVFAADGSLHDDAIQRQLAQFLQGFAAFTATQRDRTSA